MMTSCPEPMCPEPMCPEPMAPDPVHRIDRLRWFCGRCAAIVVWATGCVTGLGCGSEAPAKTPAAPVVLTGGVQLHVVAPTLWPPAAGSRVRVSRGLAGAPGVQVAAYTMPPAPFRVVPHPDQAAWIGVELVDAAGTVIAAGQTPALIVASDAPDREVPLFLVARGQALAVRDVSAKPVTLAARVGSSATALPDGSVVIAGGGAPTADGIPCAGGAPAQLDAAVRQLDPLRHDLTVIAQLAAPRAFHAAAALPGNRVALTGGYLGAPAAPGASVELLSANQATIKTAPFGLSQARARHCVVALGGRLLVVGGDGPGGGTAELWDPGTGTVATVALLGVRRRPSCEAVVDPTTGAQLVFVVGGDVGGAAVGTDVALQVDGSKLTLSGTLPPIAQAHRYEAVAATLAPLGVLRIGGLAANDAGHEQISWLQLPGAAYAALGSLSEARGCGASAVVGHTLVLAGGVSGAGRSAALAMIDLVERKVISVAMPVARAGGWVVATTNGAALIGGGTADGVVATLP